MSFKSKLLLVAKAAYNRRLIASRFPRDGILRNDGIGIVAETEYICSLSQLARDFIDRIGDTDIPYRLLNSSIRALKHPCIKDDERVHFKSLESDAFDQRHVIHFSTIPCGKDKRYCNAITPFWEFQSGMPEYRPGVFKGTDVVIAYSDFLKEYYESIVPAGVRVLKFRYPYKPIDPRGFDKASIRARFDLPRDTFTVFFNFDYSSCYERKNPEAVLTAFAEAFPSRSDDAVLVFKTSHAEDHPAKRSQLETAARRLGIAEKVRFVNEYLSRADVMALTAASNAYISLHRGEGLGMGMLEAMSLGIPVIATAYGGNTDFVRPGTAFPIPYELVPAKTDDPAYRSVREWAEPDTSAAAAAMRHLVSDSSRARNIAAAGKAFIEDYFSLREFRKSLKTFLST